MEGAEHKEPSPLYEVAVDVGDMTADQIVSALKIAPEFLNEVPFVKWVVAGFKTTKSISSFFFLKKYLYFISPLHKAIVQGSLNEGHALEICGDANRLKKVVEQTIIMLDRYQSEQKAKILSRLFCKTFIEKIFSLQEYDTLLFTIDLIHPTLGFECLALYDFFDGQMKESLTDDQRTTLFKQIANADYSPLASTGLLVLPIGGTYAGNYGGARISELGRKFFKEVVADGIRTLT